MSYQSVYRPDLFAGQVVLITGGGSGIGRCTAHELASLGATVAIAGRDAEKLAKVKAEIEAEGGRISTHICDIREEAQVIAMVDEVLAQHGRIDGLVNNAGGQYRQPLKQISSKGFEAVVRLNLFGGFMVMREVYNRWMETHGGAIVNIIADIWHGWANYAHSGAARGGMLTLSESAASEWAPSGVRVNCVAPGGIASSGFDTYEPEAQREILKFPPTIPLQRYGNVAEMSGAIVFLLSPVASYITGSCIRVDGGAPNARYCWNPPQAHQRSQPYGGFALDVMPRLLTQGPKTQSSRG
ncbi:citronellol/citronellal dehydrogenase [Solimonas aquatica]|uniref:Peroxisomal trans-2-enoyl-CoA reductase n=1 Tax=Solimonas aquatica TaxID=489703 RepID=A0A1H9BD23_9GAMM|nr:SDR family oxidoreductase [Solimonas aquatica]SEP86912.1 citronellol/citronellal dehydrogenase [Solimonas aquatica]